MKLTKGNYKKPSRALQAQWNAKLKASGFEDIEDSAGRLKSPDGRTIAFESQELIRDFFLSLSSWLNDKDSPADVPADHRKILELYINGVHVKGENGICEQTGYSDRGVRYVIEKYSKPFQGEG